MECHRGTQHVALFAWLRSRGCDRVAAIAWLRSRGCGRVAAAARLRSRLFRVPPRRSLFLASIERPIRILPATPVLQASRRLSFERWLALEHHVASMLPFSRWIDYCSIGYIISASTAGRHIAGILPLLRAVSPREFVSKRAAARRVRAAFFYRGAHHHRGHRVRGARTAGDPTEPSVTEAHVGAEDFVLGEICDRAAAFNNANNSSIELLEGAATATRLAQCLLLPPAN